MLRDFAKSLDLQLGLKVYPRTITSYKISEAASQTGFSESALRFYEQEGLVVPERLESGYRTYDDNAIESLRFVARGKQLGLSLDEITELLTLLDEERCDPVQTRMREMVDTRIQESQDQIANLVEFTAQLQQAMARLGDHTPAGPCDDNCGCTRAKTSNTSRHQIPLSAIHSEIACSLEPGAVAYRIKTWREVLRTGSEREELPNGVRVRFARDVEVTAIAELASAEQTCCNFFDFTIGISSDAVTLDITGPEKAQELITSFAGSA